MSKTLLNLQGPFGRYLYLSNKQEPMQHHFFRPYSSIKEAAIGVASIIAAPILFAGQLLAVSALYVCVLLQAIGNTITGYFSTAKDDFLKESAVFSCYFSYFALATLLSALINLIDVIGSLIATAQKDPTKTPTPAFN